MSGLRASLNEDHFQQQRMRFVEKLDEMNQAVISILMHSCRHIIYTAFTLDPNTHPAVIIDPLHCIAINSAKLCICTMVRDSKHASKLT
jgi:hypothetical protein